MKKDDRKEKTSTMVLVITRHNDCYNWLKKRENHLTLTFSQRFIQKHKTPQRKEFSGLQEVNNLGIRFAQKSPGGIDE